MWCMRGVSVHKLRSHHCQTLAGPAFPSSLLSGCHGVFSRKLVFHFGIACFDPLLIPSSSQFPRSTQDSPSCSFSLRIPKLPKLCSTSSTRQFHEDIFFRPQSTFQGIHPALGWSSACSPQMLRAAPFLSRAVSRTNATSLGSTHPEPEVEMFRSIASSLISSTRYLFQPSGSRFFRPD